MAEIKKIKVFTKAVVDDSNVGNITTFYDDGESEVLSADLLGVDPTGVDVEMNYFGVNIASGVVTVDADKVPSKLEIVMDDDGHLLVNGDNANNYSIDQSTGHLIYTE
jgi:hypothetical protein